MFFLKRVLILLSNIIFPPCCLICGKISCNTLCSECENKIYENAVFNIEKNNSFYFDKHIYIFPYGKYIRSLILDYKFNDKAYLFKIFSKIIIKNKKICRIFKSYDIIIPVPIHKKRKKERGYNQSSLIARNLAYKLPFLKYENDIIIKKYDNKRQSDLTKEQRIKNVQGVYELLNSEKIKGKNIILFDDIYTTGNTVNEISKILKMNGAKSILVLTIAKD